MITIGYRSLYTVFPVALIFAVSCRNPVLSDFDPTKEDRMLSDGGTPDTFPQDDSGVSEVCPSGTVDPFNNAMSPYLGGEESVDLEVVHFSSFNCGHCAHFAEESHGLWEQRADIRARVRIYFHHYPLGSWGIHRASVAASYQGMEHFWAIHDLVYGGMNQEPAKYYSEDEVIAFARDELKLDMERFDGDMQSDETEAFLKWDHDQGTQAGVEGTPTVFVCGKKIDRSKLESIIDGYLD